MVKSREDESDNEQMELQDQKEQMYMELASNQLANKRCFFAERLIFPQNQLDH